MRQDKTRCTTTTAVYKRPASRPAGAPAGLPLPGLQSGGAFQYSLLTSSPNRDRGTAEEDIAFLREQLGQIHVHGSAMKGSAGFTRKKNNGDSIFQLWCRSCDNTCSWRPLAIHSEKFRAWARFGSCLRTRMEIQSQQMESPADQQLTTRCFSRSKRGLALGSWSTTNRLSSLSRRSS